MAVGLTPLMRQYLDLKERYQDCLLFFRLGDFYEMFFEDAVSASRELEIVLTGRDCGLDERAPMCGVPYHSVDNYINKLIEKGYKVAICEQLTDPSQGKGLVERDVVRVITPGTVIEESMLDERTNNYILSTYLDKNGIGFAYADVSTGSFCISELMEQISQKTETQFMDELARIQPSEILSNDALTMHKSLLKKVSTSYYLQTYGDWAFELHSAKERLMRHFEVSNLDGFGCAHMNHGIRAAGALMAYLEDTQKNTLKHIHTVKTLNRSQYMLLDSSTRRNLELTKPLHYGGSKKNTLLHLLDKTKTAMGGRMLRGWVQQPLQDKEDIQKRLDSVEELYNNPVLRGELREVLSTVYDIERLCSKIAYGTVNARDCVALRISLEKIPTIVGYLDDMVVHSLRRIAREIDPMEDLCKLLEKAIEDEPPISTKEGGMIRLGYDPQVDTLRDAASNGQKWLLEMEAQEREATGIKNLRISYNKVFGYYIEVTKSYQSLVPYHYHRKQTLANAERYITPALKELEEKLLGAQEQLTALELKLFQGIREKLNENISRLQWTAALLAELDAYQSLAEVAVANQYCRPEIITEETLTIVGGRHPVVEKSMKDGFVPNDAFLDGGDHRLVLLTGPNMAGKSTYMRQIALIVLMAHIGSYVPAEKASICLVDRIFTRVGASDDLASGQSTFMVEMSEMANILHNAGSKSLLLLDEIGRGTSTYDGLSIAWAVLEHIANTPSCNAKTLFATHYHELTDLEGKLTGLVNYRTTVKEAGEEVVFLRKVMKGGADKSFGIQVARLAGLPNSVIKRAKEILRSLERLNTGKRGSKTVDLYDTQQLSLLQEDKKNEFCKEIALLDVDALTPLQALNALNEYHQTAKKLQEQGV